MIRTGWINQEESIIIKERTRKEMETTRIKNFGVGGLGVASGQCECAAGA